MACFIVPMTEAIVATAVKKSIEKNLTESPENTEKENAIRSTHIRKVKWLTNLLWGGSALLAFEHVWHGEVVPWFPFLTAAQNPANAVEVLQEMSTVGTSMAALVTVVWIGMVAVTNMLEKKSFGHTKVIEREE